MTKNKQSLLLIEDDHDLREALQDRLRVLNISVVSVKDGEEALAALAQSKFNVILSDIGMPNISGLDFLKRIRADGNETPVLFMSAYDDRDRVLDALRNGAFDFLPKPVKSVELLAAVQRALNSSVNVV
ncbi:MAG: hypothetical protein BroJett040_07730 [Oligoflexia bacterium]|nr:MAG: hypothetical protein BroJett040_07730 [Oligoflexia bacterium]